MSDKEKELMKELAKKQREHQARTFRNVLSGSTSTVPSGTASTELFSKPPVLVAADRDMLATQVRNVLGNFENAKGSIMDTNQSAMIGAVSQPCTPLIVADRALPFSTDSSNKSMNNNNTPKSAIDHSVSHFDNSRSVRRPIWRPMDDALPASTDHSSIHLVNNRVGENLNRGGERKRLDGECPARSSAVTMTNSSKNIKIKTEAITDTSKMNKSLGVVKNIKDEKQVVDLKPLPVVKAERTGNFNSVSSQSLVEQCTSSSSSMANNEPGVEGTDGQNRKRNKSGGRNVLKLELPPLEQIMEEMLRIPTPLTALVSPPMVPTPIMTTTKKLSSVPMSSAELAVRPNNFPERLLENNSSLQTKSSGQCDSLTPLGAGDPSIHHRVRRMSRSANSSPVILSSTVGQGPGPAHIFSSQATNSEAAARDLQQHQLIRKPRTLSDSSSDESIPAQDDINSNNSCARTSINIFPSRTSTGDGKHKQIVSQATCSASVDSKCLPAEKILPNNVPTRELTKIQKQHIKNSGSKSAQEFKSVEFVDTDSSDEDDDASLSVGDKKTETALFHAKDSAEPAMVDGNLNNGFPSIVVRIPTKLLPKGPPTPTTSVKAPEAESVATVKPKVPQYSPETLARMTGIATRVLPKTMKIPRKRPAAEIEQKLEHNETKGMRRDERTWEEQENGRKRRRENDNSPYDTAGMFDRRPSQSPESESEYGIYSVADRSAYLDLGRTERERPIANNVGYYDDLVPASVSDKALESCDEFGVPTTTPVDGEADDVKAAGGSKPRRSYKNIGNQWGSMVSASINVPTELSYRAANQWKNGPHSRRVSGTMDYSERHRGERNRDDRRSRRDFRRRDRVGSGDKDGGGVDSTAVCESSAGEESCNSADVVRRGGSRDLNANPRRRRHLSSSVEDALAGREWGQGGEDSANRIRREHAKTTSTQTDELVTGVINVIASTEEDVTGTVDLLKRAAVNSMSVVVEKADVEVQTIRPLDRCNEELLSDPAVYNHEARQLKHKADANTDKYSKTLSYLESVVAFIRQTDAMERLKGTDKSKVEQTTSAITKILSETIALCRGVFYKYQNQTPPNDMKLTLISIVSLRLQSFLHYRLYRLKRNDAAHVKPTVDKLCMGVQTEMTPAVLSAVKQFVTTMDQLSRSQTLAERADTLSVDYPDFFASLDLIYGDLHIHSPSSHLLPYVNDAIQRITRLSSQ